MPAPLNANELRMSTPTWRALPATALWEGKPLALAVACANVYGGCIYVLLWIIGVRVRGF